MTRIQTLTRTLSAALVISAIAVPTAGARVIDAGFFQHKDPASSESVNARGTDVSAPDQQSTAISPQQDLRSPDARDAGLRSAAVSPAQDHRSPDARAAGLRPHGHEPIASVPVQADDPGETPWLTIGLVFAGCLALAGTAATAGRIRRRSGRAGATA